MQTTRKTTTQLSERELQDYKKLLKLRGCLYEASSLASDVAHSILPFRAKRIGSFLRKELLDWADYTLRVSNAIIGQDTPENESKDSFAQSEDEFSIALQLLNFKTGNWDVVSLFTDLQVAKKTCRFCGYKSARLVDTTTGIEYCRLVGHEEIPDLQWQVAFRQWDK